MNNLLIYSEKYYNNNYHFLDNNLINFNELNQIISNETKINDKTIIWTFLKINLSSSIDLDTNTLFLNKSIKKKFNENNEKSIILTKLDIYDKQIINEYKNISNISSKNIKELSKKEFEFLANYTYNVIPLFISKKILVQGIITFDEIKELNLNKIYERTLFSKLSLNTCIRKNNNLYLFNIINGILSSNYNDLNYEINFPNLFTINMHFLLILIKNYFPYFSIK